VTPLHIRLGANNLYVLRGRDGAVCIDAGPDYDGAWDDLTAQLADGGLSPRDIGTVVLTHGHLDHAGLAARWQQAGARIAVGAADAPVLAWDVAAHGELRGRARRILHEHGVPEGSPTPIRGSRMDGKSWRIDRAERWPAPLRMTPVQPDILLHDGDAISGAGQRLCVLHCPGHTPGTIVIRDEQRRGIFTGDHLLPRQVASVGVQFDGEERRAALPRFHRSLERLHALNDWRAFPGHGAVIERAGDEIDWSLRYLDRRLNRLRQALTRGPGTAYDLALRSLPHLERDHLGPVMAETIGLLDLLEERGEATAERAGSVLVYRLLTEHAEGGRHDDSNP
jgi:glyoxylase-like metal-dependent hydrolase (beta-lactamase superfamily II)